MQRSREQSGWVRERLRAPGERTHDGFQLPRNFTLVPRNRISQVGIGYVTAELRSPVRRYPKRTRSAIPREGPLTGKSPNGRRWPYWAKVYVGTGP